MSTALELTNISSSPGEEFTVEPFSLPSLEHRFRIAPTTLSDMPTAVMGASGATLFTSHSEMGADSEHHIDTRGTTIENDLMDLLDGISNMSPLSIIGSSNDEMDPFYGAEFSKVDRNFYGRPVQRVLPTPRQAQVVRPTVVNPPAITSSTSAFTVTIPA